MRYLKQTYIPNKCSFNDSTVAAIDTTKCDDNI